MWRTRGALHTERALSAAFSKPALGLQSVVYLSPNLIHLKTSPTARLPENQIYTSDHMRKSPCRGIKNLKFYGGIVYAAKKKEFPA
jgi:hypothetical protein